MATQILRSLLTAAVVVTVAATPTDFQQRHAVKDHHRAPRGWANTGRAPADHVIDLSIGLKQNNFNELERHLYEVSDPDHVRYGQYLSAEDIHGLVKPEARTYDIVHAWLAEHAIDAQQLTYSPANDWIKVSLPVSAIETMLDTEYSVWEHEDGSMLARTETYSLPLYLHDHISTIQPTNSWARLNPRKQLRQLERRRTQFLSADHAQIDAAPVSDPAIAKACNFSAVTPDCLRTLYGTINYRPQAGSQSQIALTDYIGEYNNRSDISIFLKKYRPEAAHTAYEFPYVVIDNGPVDNGTQHAADGLGQEGNLDAEYILGISYPLKMTAYTTGGLDPSFKPDLQTPTNSDEPYLTWVNYVLKQPSNTVPQIISTSYGDDEQTVSLQYATAVCQQFAQLSARGHTLLFASGDTGVGPSGQCISNKDNKTVMFLPSFPNSCPYVTNVGATKNYPEVAADLDLGGGDIFASGAGFSNYFGAPDYQKDVVNQYVRGLNGLNNGLYNKSGRAYPEISCIGQIFPTIWNGTEDDLVGTSGSTPICSSVLALVNDALIANGKPVLGFLNPWLYKQGYKAFTDVTSGNSIGCNTNGFPAQKGWDAVTGWGTPSFKNILAARGVQQGGGWAN